MKDQIINYIRQFKVNAKTPKILINDIETSIDHLESKIESMQGMLTIQMIDGEEATTINAFHVSEWTLLSVSHRN